MIRNIILDIGNVLVPFTWREHLASFRFSEEITQRLANAVFLDPDWDEIDRGVLSDEEVIQRFVENDPEIESQIRMIMKSINGTVGAFAHTATWIPQLQEMGYRVYLLSNFSAKQLRDSAEKLPFTRQADGAIYSYLYRVIKPDDAIDQILLEKFQLKAEECLFFDDRKENVEGAIRNGLHAEVFTGYEEAMETIHRYRREI